MSASERIEQYGETVTAALAEMQEFLRAVQGVGPRRAPGGGFQWREPVFGGSLIDTLRLRWDVGGRSLTVDFWPGRPNVVGVSRTNGQGAGRRDERATNEAIEEVVGLLTREEA